MNSERKTTFIAGVLIILGMIAGILSIVPSVEGVDYLTEVAFHKEQVRLGAVFQFLLVPIYIGFALLMYPFLRQYKGNWALGFVSFRIIAGVFQLIGLILLPMFVFLSEEFITATPGELSYMETTGELLKMGRDLANHMGVMVATGLGNLTLYYVFLKARLVPKWLLIWGFAGNLLAISTSFLLLFDKIEVISTAFALLTIPLVIQELVLSVWLMLRGFKKTEK